MLTFGPWLLTDQKALELLIRLFILRWPARSSGIADVDINLYLGTWALRLMVNIIVHVNVNIIVHVNVNVNVQSNVQSNIKHSSHTLIHGFSRSPRYLAGGRRAISRDLRANSVFLSFESVQSPISSSKVLIPPTLPPPPLISSLSIAHL